MRLFVFIYASCYSSSPLSSSSSTYCGGYFDFTTPDIEGLMGSWSSSYVYCLIGARTGRPAFDISCSFVKDYSIIVRFAKFVIVDRFVISACLP
jgi:hypothetical protein